MKIIDCYHLLLDCFKMLVTEKNDNIVVKINNGQTDDIDQDTIFVSLPNFINIDGKTLNQMTGLYNIEFKVLYKFLNSTGDDTRLPDEIRLPEQFIKMISFYSTEVVKKMNDLKDSSGICFNNFTIDNCFFNDIIPSISSDNYFFTCSLYTSLYIENNFFE